VLPLFDPPRVDAKATIATAAQMGVKIKAHIGFRGDLRPGVFAFWYSKMLGFVGFDAAGCERLAVAGAGASRP
jgi:hypothetical protein